MAAGRRPPPLDHDIGRAHRPEIGHQRERAIVAHHDAIDVGDRQRKAGTLQQRADIAEIRKRCDARRHAAFTFGLGLRKRLSQFGERIAADHRRQQQPIRPQRTPDLGERTRQIVDELKGERGDRKIERFRRQPQRFGFVRFEPGDGFETIGHGLAQQRARRPDFGGIGKLPRHRGQPLFHVLGDAVEQERRRAKAPRTVLPRAQKCAVEQGAGGCRVQSQPGETAVISDLPWGRIGLTICYDVRFQALYRALAESGASFLTVPSAFTRKTGEAHWHILLRSRAIETGCFVFAAAQCGMHENKRETFGHSLIIAPWGEIIAEGGVEPGVFLAEIDTSRVETARKAVPSLQHGRRFGIADPKAGPEASGSGRGLGTTVQSLRREKDHSSRAGSRARRPTTSRPNASS